MTMINHHHSRHSNQTTTKLCTKCTYEDREPAESDDARNTIDAFSEAWRVEKITDVDGGRKQLHL
jgi:hypothetical protein